MTNQSDSLYYTFTNDSLALAFVPDSFYTVYSRLEPKKRFSGPTYTIGDTLIFTTSPYRSKEVLILAKAIYAHHSCKVVYIDPAVSKDYNWSVGIMKLWSVNVS